MPGATKVATAPGVRDLPLIELRSAKGSREPAVVISNDGGWAGIDRFADLLGGGKTGGRLTLPEIRGLRGLRLLCVYGTDETDSACWDLPADLASVAAMPGGHHLSGAYQEVARRILHAAQAN